MLEPEIYDTSTNYERCTFLVNYNRLVDMLITCNKDKEYLMLLQVIKAINKSKALEDDLSNRISEYKEISNDTLYTEETGWKNNEIGFLAYDSIGNCEILSLYISYDMLLNLIYNCKDKEYQKRCIDWLVKMPKQEIFMEKVKIMLDKLNYL